MGRKGSGKVRSDNFLKQWDQRKYLRKKKANKRKDGRDWAHVLLKQLKKAKEDE